MDAFALLALIPDEEPGGGVRKRNRSSTSQATGSAQRNRSPSRHATVSDQSEGMSAEDILALIPRGSFPRKVYKKNGMGHAIQRLQRHSSKLCMCSGSTGLVEQPGLTL